jgi:hypothetical protein
MIAIAIAREEKIKTLFLGQKTRPLHRIIADPRMIYTVT